MVTAPHVAVYAVWYAPRALLVLVFCVAPSSLEVSTTRNLPNAKKTSLLNHFLLTESAIFVCIFELMHCWARNIASPECLSAIRYTRSSIIPPLHKCLLQSIYINDPQLNNTGKNKVGHWDIIGRHFPLTLVPECLRGFPLKHFLEQYA